MSQENVELVRMVTEAFVRDDIDEALRHCHPDVVYRPAQEAPATGIAAVRAALERWADGVERRKLVAEELRDAGDRVLLTIRFQGRGRSSGVEVSSRFYELFTVRDLRIIRWEEFTDRLPALEAAGLSE
jgi:ketosteroid isomerase-like protein